MPFMKNIFQKIDIFGSEVKFSIMNKSSFKTIFGGVLSLICITMALIVTFLFGKNFYLRESPNIITQTFFKDEYPIIKPKRGEILITWRIEDVNGQTIDVSDTLFLEVVAETFQRNNDTGGLDQIRVIRFNSTKCTKEIVGDPLFYEKRNISEWNCLDWEAEADIDFGGNFDGDYFTYFYIRYAFCPLGKTYDPEKCSNISDVKNLVNQYGGAYFSINYPEFYFQANAENPMKYYYKNHFTPISFNLIRTENYYFKEVQLNDDKGWIFQDKQLSSMVTLDDVTSDYAIRLNEDLDTMTSDLFYFVMYFTKKQDVFDRSYMKVQDLAAVVGGFMKMILMAFGAVNYYFNLHSRNHAILNEIFGLKNYKGRKSKKDSKVDLQHVQMKENINESDQSNNKIMGLNQGNAMRQNLQFDLRTFPKNQILLTTKQDKQNSDLVCIFLLKFSEKSV